LLATTNFRLPSLNPGDVQPSIKPMRSQEAAVGFEQQLGNVMAGSVRYIHKQLDRGIEDTGAIDADDNELYTIANPGEGLTATYNLGEFGAYYAGSSGQYVLPKPTRNYNAVEFTLEKRLSNSWFFRGSYTLSKLSGNYPGLAESDENGRSDPNVGRMYDYPIEMYNGNGKPLDDARHRPYALPQTERHLHVQVRHDGGRQPVPGERSADRAVRRRARHARVSALLPRS
jgi:hypothetical protein